MRIFLSYGHDANEELVRRIKADLEKRGHDVWFDKSEIKFGDDWRRQITDGIIGSNRVLSFLSKHSTRNPDRHWREGRQHPDHPRRERAGGAAAGEHRSHPMAGYARLEGAACRRG